MNIFRFIFSLFLLFFFVVIFGNNAGDNYKERNKDPALSVLEKVPVLFINIGIKQTGNYNIAEKMQRHKALMANTGIYIAGKMISFKQLARSPTGLKIS